MGENDDQTLSSEVASAVENAPSPGATDDQASSSGAGETKESLLEAVQKAVPELRKDSPDRDPDGADGASPAQVAKDKPDSESEPELSEEATPEELARLSKTAQRRIKKLSAQRQKLAGEVERLRSIEPGAKAAEQVTNYLRENDIGQDDFLMGLELMSAMRRGDFKTFYEGVKPYVRLAEEYLGVSLPPDLQQRVQQGHMTTEAAAMYSKERMDRAMAQTNAARQQAILQQHRQQSTTQQQQLEKQALASQVANTVNAWEASIARSDPDYAAKKAAVQNTMWAVVKEQGIPQSPEHGVAIAKEAYRRVNEQYRAWSPQRRPTSRVPSSTGRIAGVAPEPKSLLEAVKFAREGAPRL
jgi:hypothetical protein